MVDGCTTDGRAEKSNGGVHLKESGKQIQELSSQLDRGRVHRVKGCMGVYVTAFQMGLGSITFGNHVCSILGAFGLDLIRSD